MNSKSGVLQKSIFIILLCLLFSCRNTSERVDHIPQEGKEVKIENASGFSISKFDGYSLLKVNTPWPEAKDPFVYLLYSETAKVPSGLEFDHKIAVPVKNIVVTSTTHIPALEALNEETSLIGFPGLEYISSKKTRELINSGKISELGKNENINTEVLIELSPDAVIAFAINASNKSLETIEKTGIPIIYNGDWTESTPLGKAEWIKFFGALYGKEELAADIFNKIKTEYQSAKELAAGSKEKPEVIAGSMFNDKWYMPYGNSWQASFLNDANATYIYKKTNGDGSLSLSFESVLEKGGNAEFWISSGQFTSYEQLLNESEHYNQFRAVNERNVYSVSLTKGETGGILYYELGPQRPDLVLKDLISILHADLIPEYEPVFYKPLK